MTTPTGQATTFGGLGKLEWAPTNGPDDTNPTWVDITAYLRTEDTPLSITRGRQTELDTIQPSQLTCVLDNTDNRFTFGIGTNWVPAKQIRYSETIAGQIFYLFAGNIEYPDIDDWQPVGYQEVKLTCTDRLTRLGRGRQFLSTLGAKILSALPNDLRACFPLTDNSATSQSDVGPLALGPVRVITVAHTSNYINPTPVVTPQGAVTLPGDDITPILFTPTVVPPAFGPFVGLTAQLAKTDLAVTVDTSTISLVFWMWWNSGHTDDLFVVNFQNSSGTSADLSFYRSSGTWRASFIAGATGVTLTVPTPPSQKWCLCALSMTIPSGTATFRLDANPPLTGALGGAPPSSVTFGTMSNTADNFDGSLAYLQMYVGAGYDAAAHAAQFQAGLTGLEYQTTGQRTNTILDYAGVPGSARAVDPGVSYMQKAALSTDTPGTALQDAVDTERGRGFIDGQGRYVFHDRTRIYNV